jgi:hypothetical protein
MVELARADRTPPDGVDYRDWAKARVEVAPEDDFGTKLVAQKGSTQGDAEFDF